MNTWKSKGGTAPAAGTTGLYHLAIVYPTRAALGDALQRLMRAGVPLEGRPTTGWARRFTCAIPNGNGVELYWDRPQAERPRDAEGGLAMYTRPPDLRGLLEAGNKQDSGAADDQIVLP